MCVWQCVCMGGVSSGLFPITDPSRVVGMKWQGSCPGHSLPGIKEACKEEFQMSMEFLPQSVLQLALSQEFLQSQQL